MSAIESTSKAEVLWEPAHAPAVSRHVAGTLFRVVWRWHFYAGILVAPFLLTLAVTGAAYLFRPEIERSLRSALMDVEPRSTPVGPDALIDVARKALAKDFPNVEPASLQLFPEPGRSSIVVFRAGSEREPGRGRSVRAYIDPYTGHYLGSIDSETDRLAGFFETVLAIHRRLFVGVPGRVIVELTTCWTLVLMVTGVYLWWPRRREKVRGVWVPRWRGKLYTLLRDLHAVPSVYLLPVALLIAVTGLWYTYTLGQTVRRTAENWEQGKPLFAAEERDRARPRGREGQARRARGKRPAGAERRGLPLTEVVAAAQRLYPGKVLTVSLAPGPGTGGEVSAANEPGAAGPLFTEQLVLDAGGKVLSRTNRADTSRMRWWSSWNYPLHVGSVLGLPGKVLWLLACLVLAGLPVTGVWMWWQRRPAGRTGFPRRPDRAHPRWLVALIVVLCVVLPTLGASVLLILAGEGLAGLIRGRRGARLTAPASS